jgi:hypothetical protein
MVALKTAESISREEIKRHVGPCAYVLLLLRSSTCIRTAQFTFRKGILETTLASTSDGGSESRNDNNIFGRLDANLGGRDQRRGKMSRDLLESLRGHFYNLLKKGRDFTIVY